MPYKLIGRVIALILLIPVFCILGFVFILIFGFAEYYPAAIIFDILPGFLIYETGKVFYHLLIKPEKKDDEPKFCDLSDTR